MELIGIKEVMAILDVGRETATAILNMPSCPCLPRRKGQTFRVPKEAFLEWIRSGQYE